ncbi:PA14 domain-containing protein [Confluentibacter lentus]|uniref:PA14 domain-containing protein n=1 Tax=Confluentibacter lentus TaxID=1699412 RepID=UPI000C290215|nr:PA14 domain-containing protein [Confluentibacter lentus]
MNLKKVTTPLMMLSLCMFTIITYGQIQPVSNIPDQPGQGLDGRYWKYTKGPMVKIAGDVIATINERPADANFTAKTLSYARNDISLLVDWLGEDGKSIVFSNKPKSPDVDGSVFSFTGFIAIEKAGEVKFRGVSDDACIVWIGDQKVINNDGHGGVPGKNPDGKMTFKSAGLYPIEIVYYNGSWRDYLNRYGEGVFKFEMNGAPIKTEVLYSANTIDKTLIFPSAAEKIPSEKGEGLVGRLWKRSGQPLSGLAGEGEHIIRTNPSHGLFMATKLNYAGNELTPMVDWLKEDSASLEMYYETEIANIDECLFSFNGFISIPEKGEVDFYISSDDGTILTIGGQKVIVNDGYRAAPGPSPSGKAVFMKAGLYPIEILYYNGAYKDEEAGTRGEGIMKFSINGKDVNPEILYPTTVTN